MKPIKQDWCNITFAENQPEYEPLPAHIDKNDPTVPVTSCWELTDEEVAAIVREKRIIIRVLTFGQPPQPILPYVEMPQTA